MVVGTLVSPARSLFLENVNDISRGYLTAVFDFHEYKFYHVLASIVLFLFQ